MFQEIIRVKLLLEIKFICRIMQRIALFQAIVFFILFIQNSGKFVERLNSLTMFFKVEIAFTYLSKNEIKNLSIFDFVNY